MPLGDFVIDKIMDSLGVTQEQVDKVKAIIDMVDVADKGDRVEVVINLKQIKITIDK